MDILIRYRGLMFNPRYGTVGLIAMPYYLFFEFLGPVIEVLGYVALVLGLWLGLLNLEFAWLFLLVSVGLGVFLSVTAVFLEELRLRRYERWRDLGKLVLYAILENFGYRQLTSLWRVMAIWSFLRKNTEWGDMERRGFEDPKKAEEQAQLP
jgi:hypothetical protein